MLTTTSFFQRVLSSEKIINYDVAFTNTCTVRQGGGEPFDCALCVLENRRNEFEQNFHGAQYELSTVSVLR